MTQEEQEKAFVYQWHIEPTNKYYIGSSKGIKPYYTHSSNDKEFCSYVPNHKSSVAERKEFLANMPEGITREIITYGTHEEMVILERKLQLHAKEHCWEEYYNDNVCDAVYGGFGSAEDHYNHKHGRAVGARNDPKIAAAATQVWRDNMTPEKKEEDNRKRIEKRPEKKAYDDKRYAKNKEETGYAIGYSRAKKK